MSTEIEVEEEVEIEYDDFLQFRNGEKLELENINGSDYLVGIKIDTNGNPDFFPNYQPAKGKDVSITYDKRIIQSLIGNTPFSSDRFPMNDKNKSFVNTVEAIVDIWENQVDELPDMSYPKFRTEVKIDPKTARKFLAIGAKAKLVEWKKTEDKGTFLQKKPTIKKKRLSKEDEGEINDFTAWYNKPEIQKWFNRPANTSARVGWEAKLIPNPQFDKTKPESDDNLKMIYEGAKGVAGELWKIMKIMQISPSKLASYRQYDDEALEKVKERITKDVWIDPRTAKNDPESKGKWENYRWNIIDWAKSKEAPDPYYKIVNGKYKGKKRQIQSEKTAHNTWYNFAGILIQFLETHNISVPDQEPTSIFAQLANKPKYAHISLSADQILEMKNCIKTGMTGHLPKIHKIKVVMVDYATGDKKVEEEVEEFAVDESYWKDCYFYFLLSLELGFRAEEAFTIIAREVEEESDNSGLIFFDALGNQVDFAEYDIKNNMQVQIYTRKSERPNIAGQGTRIHAGDIQSPECKQLVIDRLKEVKAGMQSKNPEKFGIRKELDGAEYVEHSLIGKDGRYTKEGTLNLPADLYQTDKEILTGGKKGTVVGINGNRDKMRGMLKHCFYFVRLRKEYWYERSLHALRHVFAQYWLILSDYNYGFVAIIGHWKTESIVREVYGKPKKGMDAMLKRKFATGINFDRDPFDLMREQEKKVAGITAQEADRSKRNYVDMARIQLEDQQLRDAIFNHGGMYGGVQYEKGAKPSSIVKVRDADSKIVEGSA